MPAWLSSLRKTVPASFRSTQLRRPGSIPVRKKNRPLLILGEKKKKERGKGEKKRVLLAQNSVVYEHVTRVGGCSLDVKGWRESSRKLAVSCSSLQGLESGFGYVFGYFITLLRYDCFLFRRKKNFRQPLDTLHPLGGVSSRIVIN